MRNRWLAAAVLLCVIVAFAHIYSIDHFLYWKYRWLDIPMHVLGGLTIGTIVVAFSGKQRPWTYIAILVAVSVGWEIFEYAFGITAHEAGYVLDTIHDLIDDGVGATIAYAMALHTIWRSA